MLLGCPAAKAGKRKRTPTRTGVATTGAKSIPVHEQSSLLPLACSHTLNYSKHATREKAKQRLLQRTRLRQGAITPAATRPDLLAASLGRAATCTRWAGHLQQTTLASAGGRVCGWVHLQHASPSRQPTTSTRRLLTLQQVNMHNTRCT